MYFQYRISIPEIFASLVLGGLVGALFSDRLKPYRKYLWMALGAVVVITCYYSPVPGPGHLAFFVVGAVVAYKFLKDAARANRGLPSTAHGSAQWADLAHLQQNGLIEPVQIVKVG